MSEKKQEKPAGNKLNVIILALLVIIIVGMLGIVGGYFFLIKGKAATTSTNQTTEVTSADENTYALDEFTVNLADTDSQKYIDIQVCLGYDEKQSNLKSELESTEVVKKPILSDAVISVLRNKKAADFSNEKGLADVKQQIIDAINPSLKKGKILHVYFLKMVIQ